MCGTGVIGGDDDSSVVDGFDGIENSLVNGCWMNFRFFLLGTDIERIETGETVVVDCCGGFMGDASVANLSFGVTISAPSWSIEGSGEPSVRTSTILLVFTYVKIIF